MYQMYQIITIFFLYSHLWFLDFSCFLNSQLTIKIKIIIPTSPRLAYNAIGRAFYFSPKVDKNPPKEAYKKAKNIQYPFQKKYFSYYFGGEGLS